MDEQHRDPTGTVLSVLYVALVFADLLIVADVISGGELHRWAGRQARGVYRWATEPLQREADTRREAAWVIWEAMQLLEDAS